MIWDILVFGQRSLSGTDMSPILSDGVVELSLTFVKGSCPVLGVVVSVDPPRKVLCLDYKYPMRRHHHVVYLLVPLAFLIVMLFKTL